VFRRLRGSAAELHGRPIEWSARSVSLCLVERPALVLGSTQSPDTVTAPSAALEVVRRRSGGGAVLVEPGRLAWVEVVVPAGDPLWHHDVGRASWWLGDAWAQVVAELGSGGAVAVHRGAMVSSLWSARVCFAGLGPGEVTVEGRKVVGISQRRTRAGALFQCAVPLAFDAGAMAERVRLVPADRAGLAAYLQDTVAVVPATEDAVADGLVRALKNL